ncbi:methyltransferase domain-containing protein [Paenibacillus sp. LMG 31456]|uniref:Methyltransferase domain-containing protein n=1 Tax=Paenibacillus foliorum TaxID=2654974 RepID=A0A972JY33_9BACL|nr:methyltransferase domain-containing protein [Paenibacillus foliorum]NOU93114.1 methyltransferase domain-containing protein [Paenibacillus foliorum]
MKVHNSTYNIRNATLGFQAEVERLKAQATMGWDKEFRNLGWYGLQDGMSILEVGSGPGFFTEQLIKSSQDIEITALEINSTLIDEAKSRLVNIPPSKLKFVNSSVYDTGLPDNSYDFAIARLLFLHLHNPLEAASEIFRVLKPGGKLVIIDIDDGIFGVVNPNLSLLPSVLQKLADYQASKGGNRYIGRSLPRLLTKAGYIELDFDIVVKHSDLHGIDSFERQFDINRFTIFYNKGIINDEEYNQIKQLSENIRNSPEAFVMMNFVMACGKKPPFTVE